MTGNLIIVKTIMSITKKNSLKSPFIQGRIEYDYINENKNEV